MITRNTIRKSSALLPLGMALLLAPLAHAANYTWVGGTGNWDAAASWTPNIALGGVNK